MIKPILSVLFFCLTLAANAQVLSVANSPTLSTLTLSDDLPTKKSKITGRVVNEGGAGQDGITVVLESLNKSVLTDPEGYFVFDELSPGSYTIVFTSVNTSSVTKTVVLEAGQVANLTIQLSSKTLTMTPVEVTVSSTKVGPKKSVQRLSDVSGTNIYVGKKSEVINFGDLDANLATNNVRQAFAKVPGITSWENDGSGVQVSVATRGLSPNRSWEFNTRQNGYDISSDPLGYPEAYYNPTFEAVERIELVRGAASLQYGSQFGGMINYVIKQPVKDRAFSFESRNTVGSYGLFSTHNQVSGTKGKVSYLGYYNQRAADGWRNNSRSNITNGYGQVGVQLTDKLSIKAELTAMNYINQQAGGLTDAMFNQDVRQSLRARNWFNISWVMPAISLDYQIAENTLFTVKTFGLLGERNSVGFLGSSILAPDTVNRVTGQYQTRTIDRDYYKNIGFEARMIHKYSWLGQTQAISGGVRYFNGSTRRVQGSGNRGNDYSMELLTPEFSRDLNFTTTNYAVFVEHLFRLTPTTSVTPGIRFESLGNTATGRVSKNFTNNTEVKFDDLSRTRTFILTGISAEQQLFDGVSLYANATQAYRPVLFSDMTPASTTDVVDQNLKDATGYNIDLGVRGAWADCLNYDIGGFYLKYNNRLAATTTLVDGQARRFLTNLNASTSTGFESYIELDILKAAKFDKAGGLNAFASVSLINARYDDFIVRSVIRDADNNITGTTDKNYNGNRVENAPASVQRYGLTYHNDWLSLTWQISVVDKIYTDALNTETANAAATIGVLPGYQVQDLTFSAKVNEQFSVSGGINNLLDARYATRRAGGYPGPGILPADGRNLFFTVAAKF